MSRYTFESFKADEPWQAEMKRKAQEFVESDEHKWFAVMGAVGAGKTHICTAVCGKLLYTGKEVRYMLWRDESVKIKAAVNDLEEYGRLVTPLKTSPVLYIYDLFKTQKDKEIKQGGDGMTAILAEILRNTI